MSASGIRYDLFPESNETVSLKYQWMLRVELARAMNDIMKYSTTVNVVNRDRNRVK